MNQNYQQALAEQQSRQQLEYDNIVNAIAAANSDIEAAKYQYADAVNRGDSVTMAEAQDRMARSNAQIVQLTAGKEAIDEQYNQQQQQYQQPQRQMTTQDMVNSLQHLTPKERVWLTEHQDLLRDQLNHGRLQVAYADAMRAGIERDSDEYFEFMNDRMNVGNGHQSSVRTLTSPSEQYVVGGPRVQEQYKSPAKPYVPNASKVSLTQQEAAEIAGVDMDTWHANNRRLQELKKQGHYQS